MGKCKATTNKVWVYMDDDLKDHLHKMANEDKISMSRFVRKLIIQEIKCREWWDEFADNFPVLAGITRGEMFSNDDSKAEAD